MRASPTLRTPGSSGAARSSCRTHRCIRWPNGAGHASAAPTSQPSGGSPTLKALWRKSSLTPRTSCRSLRRFSTYRCLQKERRNCRREELRRQQLAALTNWVMASAKVQPVVLTFEDLQLGRPDHARRAQGDRGAGRARRRSSITATTRPEFRPPWSMRSHHGTISLRTARPRAGARHGGSSLGPARAGRRKWWKTLPPAPVACRCSSRR